jgi:nitrate/nitrite-specific signal transduction histidine kinase
MVFKMERKIPLRRVVARMKAEEIHEMVNSDHPDVRKGDKEYLGLFQKAVSEYLQELPDNEKAEIEQIRSEWQDKGPPEDVQLR